MALIDAILLMLVSFTAGTLLEAFAGKSAKQLRQQKKTMLRMVTLLRRHYSNSEIHDFISEK